MANPKPASRFQRFGDLELTFATKFEFVFSYQITVISTKIKNPPASFGHPVAPDGFTPLGSICEAISEADFKARRDYPAICVKEAVSGSGALAAPTKYELVAKFENGAIWRPVPPDGFVALGHVVTASAGTYPNAKAVMCVRKELTYPGLVSDTIWAGLTGIGYGITSIQNVVPSQDYREEDEGLFAVGSFVAQPMSKSEYVPEANTLRLSCPLTEGGEPLEPTLPNRSTPPDHTTPFVDRVVTVPCTAITDPDKDLAWQLEHSPFYLVERAVYYDLLIFEDNKTNVPQTKTHSVVTGITQEVSESFSVTTGINVGFEVGVEVGGDVYGGKVTAKASLQISQELGYTSSNSVAVFESTEETAELTTPPEHAAALWSEANGIQLKRLDGSPVGPPLAFTLGNAAYLTSQYPPIDPARIPATHRSTRYKSRLKRG